MAKDKILQIERVLKDNEYTKLNASDLDKYHKALTLLAAAQNEDNFINELKQANSVLKIFVLPNDGWLSLSVESIALYTSLKSEFNDDQDAFEQLKELLRSQLASVAEQQEKLQAMEEADGFGFDFELTSQTNTDTDLEKLIRIALREEEGSDKLSERATNIIVATEKNKVIRERQAEAEITVNEKLTQIRASLATIIKDMQTPAKTNATLAEIEKNRTFGVYQNKKKEAEERNFINQFFSTDLESATKAYNDAKTAYDKAEKSLYLITEKINLVQHQQQLASEALAELSDHNLIDRVEIDNKMFFITQQEEAATKAESISAMAVPAAGAPAAQARPANSGLREDSTSRFTTQLVRHVDDLAVLANKTIKAQTSGNTKPAEEGLSIAPDIAQPVYYRKVRLEATDIIQTTGKLNNGTLYLEKSSEGMVTSRSVQEHKTPLTNEDKQDLKDIAFEHARLFLDGYDPKHGIVIKPLPGAKHDKDAANRVYAALLVLGKNIPNLKIKSEVYGCTGPKTVQYYGQSHENEQFIKAHLDVIGYTKDARKEEQTKYANEMRLIRPAVVPTESADEGSRIDITPGNNRPGS